MLPYVVGGMLLTLLIHYHMIELIHLSSKCLSPTKKLSSSRTTVVENPKPNPKLNQEEGKTQNPKTREP